MCLIVSLSVFFKKESILQFYNFGYLILIMNTNFVLHFTHAVFTNLI